MQHYINAFICRPGYRIPDKSKFLCFFIETQSFTIHSKIIPINFSLDLATVKLQAVQYVHLFYNLFVNPTVGLACADYNFLHLNMVLSSSLDLEHFEEKQKFCI